MNKKFSIYDSPFSEETKRIKRNVLVASSICIFIGLTNQLPASFTLWGAEFDTKQQIMVGWFLFSVTAYFYIYFVSNAGIEIAKWIQPFYIGVVKRKKLLKHPAFDETDWMSFLQPYDEHSIEHITALAENEAEIYVKKRLRYLYGLIYLKLITEALVPLLIGAFGLIELLILICNSYN